MRQSEAVSLFVDHARLVLPDFEITEANAAAIAEICRRLDGIALALELAAARVRVLSLEDIRARLDDRFRLLTGGSRAMPRHQTLQATMQWSHDHLTSAEQRLLRRLAVFVGGCTLDAAAVVAGDGGDEYDVLERLTALHDKSLLLVDRDTRAQPRYRMLETVRQYAEERLNEAGEGDTVRTRHLSYCVALAERMDAGLRGTNVADACTRLRSEQDNLLAAHRWCAHAPGGRALALRLVGRCWRYWKLTSQQRQGHALAVAAIAAAADDTDARDRCEALQAQARLASCMGLYEEALVCGSRSLALARTEEDAALVAGALTATAVALHATGRATEALQHYEAACASARVAGDHVALSAALNGIAEVHRGMGELATARAVYEQSRAHACANSNKLCLVTTLCNLSSLLVAMDEPLEARAALMEAVAGARDVDLAGSLVCAPDWAAMLASSIGRHADAARWHGVAQARLQEAGIRHEPVDDAFIAPRIAASREALGPARFDALLEEGRRRAFETSSAELYHWLAQLEMRASG
jgi:tetratricopeptide (TPR) repeat protein